MLLVPEEVGSGGHRLLREPRDFPRVRPRLLLCLRWVRSAQPEPRLLLAPRPVVPVVVVRVHRLPGPAGAGGHRQADEDLRQPPVVGHQLLLLVGRQAADPADDLLRLRVVFRDALDPPPQRLRSLLVAGHQRGRLPRRLAARARCLRCRLPRVDPRSHPCRHHRRHGSGLKHLVDVRLVLRGCRPHPVADRGQRGRVHRRRLTPPGRDDQRLLRAHGVRRRDAHLGAGRHPQPAVGRHLAAVGGGGGHHHRRERPAVGHRLGRRRPPPLLGAGGPLHLAAAPCRVVQPGALGGAGLHLPHRLAVVGVLLVHQRLEPARREPWSRRHRRAVPAERRRRAREVHRRAGRIRHLRRPGPLVVLRLLGSGLLPAVPGQPGGGRGVQVERWRRLARGRALRPPRARRHRAGRVARRGRPRTHPVWPAPEPPLQPSDEAGRRQHREPPELRPRRAAGHRRLAHRAGPRIRRGRGDRRAGAGVGDQPPGRPPRQRVVVGSGHQHAADARGERPGRPQRLPGSGGLGGGGAVGWEFPRMLVSIAREHQHCRPAVQHLEGEHPPQVLPLPRGAGRAPRRPFVLLVSREPPLTRVPLLCECYYGCALGVHARVRIGGAAGPCPRPAHHRHPLRRGGVGVPRLDYEVEPRVGRAHRSRELALHADADGRGAGGRHGAQRALRRRERRDRRGRALLLAAHREREAVVDVHHFRRRRRPLLGPRVQHEGRIGGVGGWVRCREVYSHPAVLPRRCRC